LNTEVYSPFATIYINPVIKVLLCGATDNINCCLALNAKDAIQFHQNKLCLALQEHTA